jgi:NAD(P)-dependent dehydrogenase (short-subunit alcohol dehydrogenase family)
MAADFGSFGVRVNAIAPGEIDTAMLSPDEVAKIIYVLCTDTASYVNGAEIHINGASTCERVKRFALNQFHRLSVS